MNLSAGSAHYNPHPQRPSAFPPSDGYLPPKTLYSASLSQMQVTRALKQQFPNMIMVGSACTPPAGFHHVAQGAVREGWVDCVGLWTEWNACLPMAFRSM